ncbi:hypothetical protein ACFE04_015196 [Oxalis oulophora]
MDCDDNDLKSQNLQSVGEGTKYLPVLQSYALPKFDFDDNLHGNLRFDSLESEVFLGIEGNVDNNWIEDYSRGSTEIQFSSTVSETCSIPRRTDVWSEATSSESVEMLLKSVGQEENIAAQTTIEESDTCDELGSIVKKMEHSSKDRDNSLSKVEDVRDLQPLDETSGNFSELEDIVNGKKPQSEDFSPTESVRDRCNIEEQVDYSVYGVEYPINQAAHANLEENIGSGHHLEIPDSKVDPIGEQNTAEASTVHLDEHSEKNLMGATILHKVEGSSCSVDSRNNEQVLEVRDNVLKDMEDVDETKINIPVTTEKDDSSRRHGVEVNNIKPIEGENTANDNSDNLDEPSKEILMGSTAFHKLEATSYSVDSNNPARVVECEDVFKHMEAVDETKMNLQPGTLEEDASFKSHEAEITYKKPREEDNNAEASYDNVDEPSEIILKGDTDFHKVERIDSINTDEVLECEDMFKDTDAIDQTANSSPEVEEDTSFKSHGVEISNVELSGSEPEKVSIEISPELTCCTEKKDLVESGIQLDSVIIVSKPEDGLLNTVPVLSTGISEAVMVPMSSDADECDQSVSIVEKRGTFSARFSSEESEVTGSTVINESGGGSNADELIVSTCDATAENMSGSAETQNFVSAQTNSDIAMPSWKSVGQIAVHRHQKEASPAVEDLEHEGDKVSIIPLEVGLSSLKSPLVAMEIDRPLKLVEESHSRSQEGLVNHGNRESENIMQVDGAEVSVIVEKEKEVPVKTIHEEVSVVADEIPKDPEVSTQHVILRQNEPENKCRNGLDATEGPFMSTEKNSEHDTAEDIDGDAQKTTGGSLNSSLLSGSPPGFPAPESEALCTDNEKSSCGSPTVIKATVELPRTDSENARVEGSSDQNIPVAVTNEKDSSNVLAISPDLGQDGSFKVGDSFSFEVKSLVDSSMKEAAASWQPFTIMRSSNLSPAVECSPSTSSLAQLDPTTPVPSPTNLNLSSVKVVQSGSRAPSERKPRRASAKASGGKVTSKKDSAKETSPVSRRKSVKGNKTTSSVPHSPSGIGQLVQSTEIQQHVVVKPLTSGLPDLNTSSTSGLFLQPFTDLQQVQLRAQIFVYGALIQGTVPDEAYMISAFGGHDGGKGMWDDAWRACVDRLHGQKSYLTTPEQSRSGTRVNDQSNKQSASQSNIFSTVGRASNKANKTSAVPLASPLGPLSSPLWSIPTSSSDAMQPTAFSRAGIIDYQHTLTPLHPQQTPPVRNFVAPNPPWMSQSPFRAPSPWVGSPHTSAFDNNAHFPKSPNTEMVKLTPVKEPSVPRSVSKHGPTSIVQSGATSVSAYGDAKNIIPGHQSTDPKPRKRKKNVISEDQNQIVLNFPLHTEPVSVSTPFTGINLSAPISTSNLVSKTLTEKLIMPVSPSPASEHLSKGDTDSDHRAKLSYESLNKLNEAKTNAENASAFAISAINGCQEIWNQMGPLKNSTWEPDLETKLTSAAMAVAAAAAVAKAAAAAANVASNAALQAKLMFEEALSASIHGNSRQAGTILGNASPSSILKGAEVGNSSGSVILAAREASRKRLEAATAASQRAENMDAVIKAAELAAEAVSQAGKIVAMGDPLPLRTLVEAGPENHWKVTQVYQENMNRENLNASGDGVEVSATQVEVSKDKIESQTIGETPSESMNPIKSTGDISSSVAASVKDKIVHKDLVTENLKENCIREGSLVEVYKDESSFKKGWYTATVLSLKDEKAFVCYNDVLVSNLTSSEKLKEWVNLCCEIAKPPTVRLARPITAVPFEGTRKRRRAAMGDYSWFVGDKVDVWMQDSWWEGIVTEQNKKDDTTLSVNFPANKQTSVVKAWYVRPSLDWKDGEWIGFSSSKGKDILSLEGGDTPNEKRQRVISPPANEAKGKDKTSEVTELAKPDEPSKLLDLSDNAKTFNPGKTTNDEHKPGGLRMARTGLQKERSKVVFGVPKQGKKRKFMEVSKHYTADKGKKVNEANDSVKFTKHLMPQAAGSRAVRNVTKNEPKEKQAAAAPATSKPRVPKPGKPQSFRSIPQKENSASHVENTSGKHSSMEFGSISSSEGASESPMVFSSTADGPKRTSNTRSERANKGKLALGGRTLAKIVEDKVSTGNSSKSTSEVVEPRRSVRRIQPTSRLLEGLQSSLIVSKIPSFSHDKGHRSQNRNNSKETNDTAVNRKQQWLIREHPQLRSQLKGNSNNWNLQQGSLCYILDAHDILVLYWHHFHLLAFAKETFGKTVAYLSSKMDVDLCIYYHHNLWQGCPLPW